MDAIFISARKNLKINNLIKSIEDFCMQHYIEEKIEINYADSKLLDYIYKNAEVIDQVNNPDRMILHIKALKKDINKIKSKINY